VVTTLLGLTALNITDAVISVISAAEEWASLTPGGSKARFDPHVRTGRRRLTRTDMGTLGEPCAVSCVEHMLDMQIRSSAVPPSAEDRA